MIDKVLTKKRCGILLIVACLIHFIFNIVIWTMNLVTAVSGAICTTIAIGLFLYFISEVSKKQTLNLAKVGSKNRVCLPPNLVNHLDVQPKDNIVLILRTGKDGKNYTCMHRVKEEDKEQKGEKVPG